MTASWWEEEMERRSLIKIRPSPCSRLTRLPLLNFHPCSRSSSSTTSRPSTNPLIGVLIPLKLRARVPHSVLARFRSSTLLHRNSLWSRSNLSRYQLELYKAQYASESRAYGEGKANWRMNGNRDPLTASRVALGRPR